MEKKIVILSMMVLLSIPVANAYTSLTVSGSVVPTTMGPGDSGNIIFTITNGGTSYARNVELKVKSHGHITFDQKIFDLQTIASGDSMQVSVPMTVLSTIPVDTTTVFVDVTYTEGSTSGSKTITSSTSVSLSRRSIIQVENVTTDKDIIEPGDTVDIDVYIKNSGVGTLKDSSVKFGNSSLPFVSADGDDEVYLGDLTTSEVDVASFSITFNREAETKAYRVPVTVEYYDASGTLHSTTKYIGLKVSGEPEFITALEDDSEMYSGGQGEITISIANRGTATANYLTLTFDSDLKVKPKEYYVGNLDPDDYEVMTLSVDGTQLGVGKKTMEINLRYKDPYNNELNSTASVEFDVYRQTSGLSTTNIAVILVIIGIVAYYKRKRLLKIIKRK